MSPFLLRPRFITSAKTCEETAVQKMDPGAPILFALTAVSDSLPVHGARTIDALERARRVGVVPDFSQYRTQSSISFVPRHFFKPCFGE